MRWPRSISTMFPNVAFDKTDYSSGTEMYGNMIDLIKPWEYLITPDHFGCWKRHVAWGKSDGKCLRQHVTTRFSSSMVFLSLLLSAQLSILFNSAQVASSIRQSLLHARWSTLEFYVGLTIIGGVFMSLFGILTTYTAWGMVSSVSDMNALSVLRSSIGQYVTQLPSRLVAGSLFLFLTWMIMFLFILLPAYLGVFFLIVCVALYLHMVHVFSTFGRLLMHSGAMGDKAIFDTREENTLLPEDFHKRLGMKAKEQVQRRTSVTVQYKEKQFHRSFRNLLERERTWHQPRKQSHHRRDPSAESVDDFSVAEQEMIDEWAATNSVRRPSLAASTSSLHPLKTSFLAPAAGPSSSKAASRPSSVGPPSQVPMRGAWSTSILRKPHKHDIESGHESSSTVSGGGRVRFFQYSPTTEETVSLSPRDDSFDEEEVARHDEEPPRTSSIDEEEGSVLAAKHLARAQSSSAFLRNAHRLPSWDADHLDKSLAEAVDEDKKRLSDVLEELNNSASDNDDEDTEIIGSHSLRCGQPASSHTGPGQSRTREGASPLLDPDTQPAPMRSVSFEINSSKSHRRVSSDLSDYGAFVAAAATEVPPPSLNGGSYFPGKQHSMLSKLKLYSIKSIGDSSVGDESVDGPGKDSSLAIAPYRNSSGTMPSSLGTGTCLHQQKTSECNDTSYLVSPQILESMTPPSIEEGGSPRLPCSDEREHLLSHCKAQSSYTQ